MENSTQWAVYSAPVTTRDRIISAGEWLPDEDGEIYLTDSYDDACLTAAGATLMCGIPFSAVEWKPSIPLSSQQ